VTLFTEMVLILQQHVACDTATAQQQCCQQWTRIQRLTHSTVAIFVFSRRCRFIRVDAREVSDLVILPTISLFQICCQFLLLFLTLMLSLYMWNCSNVFMREPRKKLSINNLQLNDTYADIHNPIFKLIATQYK
jgi:hypothetical protein